MKRQRSVVCLTAMGLAVLLLCGCQRVSAPQEELLPTGRPVEDIPSDVQPDETPEIPSEDLSPKTQVLEEGLCALLPKEDSGYVLYDCYGEAVAQIVSEDPNLTGVYPCAAIVAGYRLADGSQVMKNLSVDTQWIQDDAGFTVWDKTAELVYRLDSAGQLQFFCNVPIGATQISLLPLGRDFLYSAWLGAGTAEEPWQAAVAGLVLNAEGSVEMDLSSWLPGPAVGVLGGEILLVGCEEKSTVAAYTLQGMCLAQDLHILQEVDAQPALGGVVCRFVWRNGWICSAGLQPQVVCADPDAVVLCGDYVSGVQYNMDGISSNGELLLCGADAAIWSVQNGVLAIQWQGINYHFPAGARAHQRLQRCDEKMAVAYAWDDDGSGCLRLLFLETGTILEYNCPAGNAVSAALGKDHAVFVMSQEEANRPATSFWVVDAAGTLRYQGDVPVRPCDAGAYLLMQSPNGISIANLDGTPLISQ